MDVKSNGMDALAGTFALTLEALIRRDFAWFARAAVDIINS